MEIERPLRSLEVILPRGHEAGLEALRTPGFGVPLVNEVLVVLDRRGGFGGRGWGFLGSFFNFLLHGRSVGAPAGVRFVLDRSSLFGDRSGGFDDRDFFGFLPDFRAAGAIARAQTVRFVLDRSGRPPFQRLVAADPQVSELADLVSARLRQILKWLGRQILGRDSLTPVPSIAERRYLSGPHITPYLAPDGLDRLVATEPAT